MPESNVKVFIDFITRGLENIKNAAQNLIGLQNVSQSVGKEGIKAFNKLENALSNSEASSAKLGEAISNSAESVNTLAAAGFLVKRFGSSFFYTEKQLETFNKLMNIGNVTFEQLQNRMSVMNLAVDESGRIFETVTGRQIGMRQATERLRLSTQRFRMELLSVMFFGWQVASTFSGMIRPAMEAYGVFELWNAMLLVTFIPIMDVIAPLLYELMFWFMSLPDPVKKAIGVFAITAIVVGTLFEKFGMLGLGIQGLKILFGIFPSLGGIVASTFTFMKTAVSGFVSFLAANPIVLIIMGIIAAVLLLNQVWKNNWFGIRQAFGNFLIFLSGGVSGIIAPILKFIGSAVIVLSNVFISALGTMYGMWKLVWSSVKLVAVSVWGGLLTLFGNLINGIISILNWFIGSPLVQKFAEILGFNIKPIKELDLSGITKSISQAYNDVKSSFTGIYNVVADRSQKTIDSLESWSSTMDNLSPILRELGEKSIETGNMIDAGLVEGSGFLGGAFNAVKNAVSSVSNSITSQFKPAQDSATQSVYASYNAINAYSPAVYSASHAIDVLSDSIDDERMALLRSSATLTGNTVPSLQQLNSTLDASSVGWTNYGKNAISVTREINTSVMTLSNSVAGYANILKSIPSYVSTRIVKTEETYKKAFKWVGTPTVGFWVAMQRGGIVRRPTPALIGEAGPEAVIPLSKMGRMERSSYVINYSPVINVSATVSQDIDINRLINKLDDHIINKLKSMVVM